MSSPPIAELLRALSAVMAAQQRAWYLFGAQAAIIWGSPRFSQDADVTAYLDFAEIDEFAETMNRHGFDRIVDRDFVERTRVLRFVHRATRVPLDVVLGGPGFEEEFLRRAIPVDVSGTSIPVMSPEDLIITKILAGRATDVEDVRGVILARKSSLDVERIRAVLHLLEEVLTRSDLLPVFERIWGED